MTTAECRNCHNRYDVGEARGYDGYCGRACAYAKARKLGWRPRGSFHQPFEALQRAGEVGLLNAWAGEEAA